VTSLWCPADISIANLDFFFSYYTHVDIFLCTTAGTMEPLDLASKFSSSTPLGPQMDFIVPLPMRQPASLYIDSLPPKHCWPTSTPLAYFQAAGLPTVPLSTSSSSILSSSSSSYLIDFVIVVIHPLSQRSFYSIFPFKCDWIPLYSYFFLFSF
jgi:hypothetical protein